VTATFVATTGAGSVPALDGLFALTRTLGRGVMGSTLAWLVGSEGFATGSEGFATAAEGFAIGSDAFVRAGGCFVSLVGRRAAISFPGEFGVVVWPLEDLVGVAIVPLEDFAAGAGACLLEDFVGVATALVCPLEDLVVGALVRPLEDFAGDSRAPLELRPLVVVRADWGERAVGRFFVAMGSLVTRWETRDAPRADAARRRSRAPLPSW